MKITIENIDIWQCQQALYCKRSDGHLIKIQSPHLDKVLKVLTDLQDNRPWQDMVDEQVSQEERNEIIRFLLQNQIVRFEHSNPDGHILHKQIGVYAHNDIFAQVQQQLRVDGFQFSFKQVSQQEDLNGIHFLLVIAPVFDHYRQLEELSNHCYRRQLPLLYAEFSPTCFSIGPLVEPSMETPSLACYMKRKKVNLNNLSLYSEFIRSEDKSLLQAVKSSEYLYFGIGMDLLKIELAYYWKYQAQLSTRLMGKSISIDFVQYSCEHSRILKDPMSALFSKTPYTPFNA